MPLSFFSTPEADLVLQKLGNQVWRNGFFDVIMPFISMKTPLFVIVGGLMLFRYFKNGLKALVPFLLILLALGFTDFSGNFIKKSIKRVRPLNAIAGTYFHEGGEWQRRPADFVQTKKQGQSYPSSHAANTMCLAIMIMLLWKKAKGLPLLIPLMVGWSRIYLGKHYPTDVVAGWLYGIVCAGIIWLLWTTFFPKLAAQFSSKNEASAR